ncbi:MAG: hypothetical protein MUF58_21545 [Arcicella sp.]|jgi:hypothetical protein|nr:hypothetical protein [Microscillaceae bacterium]MCU0471172.1 hypothetical protein [Arcicella sp.]
MNKESYSYKAYIIQNKKMKTTEKPLKIDLNEELLQKIKKALKEKPIGQDKMKRAKELFAKGIPDWDKLT